MSIYRSVGLSISAFKPTIDTSTPLYTPAGTLVTDQLGQQVDSYEHEILADGGFWAARFTIQASRPVLEEWFDQGLNRHIEVYGPELTLLWEGFVNQIEYSAGALSAVHGPLMDATNRTSVVYTPILDATTDPPTTGVQQSTTVADDDDSRAKYAVLETVLSQGQLLDDGTTDQAEQIRDTYLEENAWPKSTQSLGLGDSSQPSITVSCLGYVHRLSRYIVQDTTAATVQISNNAGTGKLQLAIAADPNGMFPATYSKTDNNAFLASRYENGNRMAWDVIQELVSVGDVNDDRYTFGVYDGRIATYTVKPTDVLYQRKLGGARMALEHFGSEQDVMPWLVRPAQWVFLPNFLTGKSEPLTRASDPRYEFIESVRYTAPFGLQISGNPDSRLDRMLAKLGMR